MCDKYISIDVNVAGADKLNTLAELLHKHRESLPAELVSSLVDLADCDECEVGVGNISSPHSCRAMIDGKVEDRVVSVNRILGRVTLIDASGEKYFKYPKSASIVSPDNKILVNF